MKRTLSFGEGRETALVVAGTCLIAGTYGLVRLAYGLFLPDMQKSVSMSSAVAGYVSSGGSAAYCVGALVGLLPAARPRALVVGAAVTACAGSIGMATAPDLKVLAPSAVVASAGAGLASPALVAVVGRNLTAARVDRAQATVNAGTGPGLVAAGLLALVVPQWRLGFAVSAVFTAAAGVCVLALDRHSAEDRTTRTPRAGSPAGRSWIALLLRPAMAAVLLGAGSATVWTYGRAHLVAAGASDTESVLAWVALGVGGTATVLTAGRLGGLPASWAWLLTTAAVAVATAALAAPRGLAAAVAACGVFGWGFVAATSALIAWSARLVPHQAASGTSVVFIALVVGQAAGSAAAGILSDGIGMSSTFLVAALITAVAAACGVTRGHGRPRARAEEPRGGAARPPAQLRGTAAAPRRTSSGS